MSVTDVSSFLLSKWKYLLKSCVCLYLLKFAIKNGKNQNIVKQHTFMMLQVSISNCMNLFVGRAEAPQADEEN
jgi:hypothetical protein